MPDKKRTSIPTDEEIDVLTAAVAALPSGVECAALCDDLLAAFDDFDQAATDQEKNRALRRIRMIKDRRRFLHCLPCFFQ